MRARTTGRVVGRAVAVALLGLGLSAAVSTAAHASDWTWQSVPTDAVTDAGTDGAAPASINDWTWN
jgi:hypothetical protein